MWKLAIQSHSKLSITEKRRNKAEYLTWDFIRLKFGKNTNKLNPVQRLGYIKGYRSSRHRPVKISSNSIRYNCKKICSWTKLCCIYYQTNLILTHGHRFRLCSKLMCSRFSKATQPLAFIKHNIIRKLAYKVKYVSQINGGLIIFFLEIWE